MARQTEIPKPRRTPMTTLMGITELPQCKGIVPQKIKGQKLPPMRHAQCPIHGNSGTETTWRPPEGLDKHMREFHCELGHAFYC
jgi:hypothetical protein